MACSQDGPEESASLAHHGWPDSRSFWSGRRVMVTGGYRFLGKLIVGEVQVRDLEPGVMA
jgi:hypothetical protein